MSAGQSGAGQALAAWPETRQSGSGRVQTACSGPGQGGAGCLTHGEKNKAEVDKYGKEAMEKTIKDAVDFLNM